MEKKNRGIVITGMGFCGIVAATLIATSRLQDQQEDPQEGTEDIPFQDAINYIEQPRSFSGQPEPPKCKGFKHQYIKTTIREKGYSKEIWVCSCGRKA